MNILSLIDEIIDKNNKLIDKLNNDKREYTIEELLKLDLDELETLLKENKVFDIASKLDIIMNYHYLVNLDNQLSSIFKESINNYELKMKEIMDEIIIKIHKKNADINKKIIELQNDIDSLSKIKLIIQNTKQYSNTSYNEICDILLQSKVDDEVLAILIPEICNYLLLLSKDDKYDIDSFEEQVGKESLKVTNNNDEIRKKTIAILEMYQDSNSKYYIPNITYNGLNSEELEDVLSIIKDEGFDEISFKWIIGIYINEILNSDNQDDIVKYYNELCLLTENYKKSINYKETLQLKEAELSELLKYIELDNGYINNIKAFLENIKTNQLFIISDEYYQNTLNLLTKYIAVLKKYLNNQGKIRQPIKHLDHFVLFAESKDNEPYFTIDLFDPKHNMIDNRNFSNTEYFKEFSDLILDLFEYGEPSYTKFIDSKNSTNFDRVIMHIFYPTKKGIVDRDNPTDMWRIRPNLSSNARFVEIKVVIPCNTIIHKQVKEIILKYLPHIKTDDDKNFTFVVNIGAAVKLADVELYSEAIKRYDFTGIDILKLFYVNGKYHKKENGVMKKALNDEEYRMLDSYIANTLKTLKKLENMDIDFQFSPLLGGSTYGYTK